MAVTRTLLLADDSVAIRRVIELTFADENVRVVSVSSGRDALAGIEASPPDIIMADAGMPDVSGYDIAAFVKGRSDLRHIPVILLAGAFEPLDEARARQSGSDGVLVKPFEPHMAVARVRELLSAVEGQASSAASIAAPAPEAAAPAPYAAPPVVPVEPAFDASIDAAFAPSAGEGPAEFGDWDLPLRPPIETADVSDTPRFEPLPPPIARAPDSPPAAGAAPPTDVHGAPLAEAFTTLLAAEEGRPHGPLPAIFGPKPQAGSALSAEEVEVIVDRLMERLGGDVRGIVLDLAERLVKAEIERLKALR